MEINVLICVSLATFFVVCIELCETSDQTCIKQLNSFKVELRDNINSINTDIETLLKSVEDIRTALLSKGQTNTQDLLESRGSLDSKETSVKRCSENNEIIAILEKCVLTNVDLLKAFKSERQLNRKLETRVQGVEDIISRMARDMDALHAFTDHINDTLKERTAARRFDKNADLIHKGSMNGDDDKGIGTTFTVGETTGTVGTTTGIARTTTPSVGTTTSSVGTKTTTDRVTAAAVGATTSTAGATAANVGVTTSTIGATTASVGVTTTAAETRTVVETTQRICADKIGVFGIYLKSLRTEKSIYCDADTDGGDWIVIMRRQDGSVDFDRKWNDYKNGFGNVDGEFWIGNDVLHELTKFKPMELRIDMEDYRGNKAFAKYEHFQVGSEAEKYVLTVNGYFGSAGDSLDKVEHPGGIHNGHKFTTIDSDNDKEGGRNCARSYPGGWWFNNCFR